MNQKLQNYLNSLDATLSTPNIDVFVELNKAFAAIKAIESDQSCSSDEFDIFDKSEYLVFSLFFEDTLLYQEKKDSLFLRDYKNDVDKILVIFEANQDNILNYWRQRAQTVKSKTLKSQYLTLVLKYTEESCADFEEVKSLSQTNIDFCSENSDAISLNQKLILLTEALNLALFFSVKKLEKDNSFFRGAFISGIDFLDANQGTAITDGWKYYWDVLIEFLFINHIATTFLEKPVLQRVTNQFDFIAGESFKNFLFEENNLKKVVDNNPKVSDLSVEEYRKEYTNAVGFRFLAFAQGSIVSLKKVKSKVFDIINALFAAQRFFLIVYSEETSRLKVMITHWFRQFTKTIAKRSPAPKGRMDASGSLADDVNWLVNKFTITPADVEVPAKYLDMPPFLMLINKFAFNFKHPEDFKNWVTWAVLISKNEYLETSMLEFKKRNPDPAEFYSIFDSQPFFDQWTKLPDNQNVLKSSLENYWKGNFIESITVILSFFEETIRKLVAVQDGNWIDFDRYGILKTITLGALMFDNYNVSLLNNFFKELTPNMVFHFQNMLSSDTGLNLRNTLAHGAGDDQFITLQDSSNWFFQLLCIFSKIMIDTGKYRFSSPKSFNKRTLRKGLDRKRSCFFRR